MSNRNHRWACGSFNINTTCEKCGIRADYLLGLVQKSIERDQARRKIFDGFRDAAASGRKDDMVKYAEQLNKINEDAVNTEFPCMTDEEAVVREIVT